MDPIGSLKQIMNRGKEFNIGPTLVAYEMAGALKELMAFQKFNAKQDKDFDAWVKKEPGQAMAFLDKKLKLGGPRAQSYKDVEKELGNDLKSIAQSIKTIQTKDRTDFKSLVKTLESDAKLIFKYAKNQEKSNRGDVRLNPVEAR